jgi:hypothetical protein
VNKWPKPYYAPLPRYPSFCNLAPYVTRSHTRSRVCVNVPNRSDPKGIAGQWRCVVGRGKRIKSVIKVAALAVAIAAENYLHRKMHHYGWQVRP